MTNSIKKPLVGAHVSIATSLHGAVQYAHSIGANTMQIFTKSNRSYTAKSLTAEEIILFKQAVKKTGLSHISAHSSFLINIGSPDAQISKKSTLSLATELTRCQQLGIPYLTLHPGSHTGSGPEACIKKIAQNLDTVLTCANGTTTICLENMAGQGTNMGGTFEQLQEIINLCEHKKYIGVCFDTCHAFCAGYDISTEKKYNSVIELFDSIIGLAKLKVIHINDSKLPLGSHKDRHESLGKGLIPLEVFAYIMNDERLINIPKILETPEPELYEQEIVMLKNMIK
ncbi:MAG: deoxyribonuclease IV [bacterium]